MMKISVFVIFIVLAFKATSNADQRIISGVAAEAGQFPWMVGITVRRTQSTVFCGGALIRQNRVLTAAHCIDRHTDIISLTLDFGGITLAPSEAGRSTLFIPHVDQDIVVIHPSYIPQYMEYDIGIIRLPMNAPITNRIQSISLPAAGDILPESTTVRISGFGMANNQSTGLSNVLRWNTLITTTPVACTNAFGMINTTLIVCANGYPNQGNNICHGDFGGPLVIYDGLYSTLVGVASFIHQDGCGSNRPAAFTRVQSVWGWIIEEMQRG